MNKKWTPLNPEKLKQIKSLFAATYPEAEYGSLAADITSFWTDLLEKSWEKKSEELKALDLAYNPEDPLSRVEQKTTVITYADSISREGEPSFKTLDNFMKEWFPNIGGLHILPACTVVEDRFNDGYFSQVVRNSIHSGFGSNKLFADIAHRYFSMNDLVMGHVDIENPAFKAYLAGDDDAGKTFYTFTMEEHKKLEVAGSFAKVFRPRPFPLFTIFRRLPTEEPQRSMSFEGRLKTMKDLLLKETGAMVDEEVVGILYLYEKLKNDQMLLSENVNLITAFLAWLQVNDGDPNTIFTKSITQEVQHTPWILKPEVDSRSTLLKLAGIKQAEAVAALFEQNHWNIFGEEIRALTTFSHVQVDVNTTTLEGLKRFAEDLSWYLTMDLNMLRLDAVNYAFKKWGTSCFGLPELDQLMKIVYLSMDCISPRMIPNLEVNDSLTTILNTMTSGDAAPPMMHAFHLASLMPTVFHQQDPTILQRIFDKIDEYDVPKDSIRFSLSESHDGKSVRGSMDLMQFEERRVLTEAVLANKGYVKYKSILPRLCTSADLEKFCAENGFTAGAIASAIFTTDEDGNYNLKDGIQSVEDILAAVPELGGEREKTSGFFFTRILQGRDPYELCVTTRDALPALNNETQEAERFLAFETLSFAVMGRNVKTIYFNDLLGLPNDYDRVKGSGELRDIKRTKTDYDAILPELENSDSFTSRVATGVNELIGVVDSDPALHFRGNEAKIISTDGPVAAVKNRCGDAVTLTLVNLSANEVEVEVPFTGSPTDKLGGGSLKAEKGNVSAVLKPFGRMWLQG